MGDTWLGLVIGGSALAVALTMAISLYWLERRRAAAEGLRSSRLLARRVRQVLRAQAGEVAAPHAWCTLSAASARRDR